MKLSGHYVDIQSTKLFAGSPAYVAIRKNGLVLPEG
jgi:hypothetical protein